jgi:nicotinate phosphoribosyltransferase
MVFSNALDTDKYIAIDQYFRKFAQPCGGIGTHFTNDVGVQPLNMVIKLVSADFGYGWRNTAKISDDISKASGDLETINEIKKRIGIL